MTNRSVGLVHLVWGPLGPDPLAAFVRSYRRLDPGEPHELVVVFNGVEHGAPRALLLEQFADVEHRLIELDHPVVDVAAYFEAAVRVGHERLCFLNSYSEPLSGGWLGLLARAGNDPAAGIVGATGSWGSHSSHVRCLLGLGGPYASFYGERSRAQSAFAALGGPAPEPSSRGAGGRGAGGAGAGGAGASKRIASARLLLRQLGGFDPFPVPHLRTNGFLIERELMLKLAPGRLRDKGDAYALESGRRSLTRQLEQLGRQALVVGRDGTTYPPSEWPDSHTFWQAAQENLLIADNQTRAYENGDPVTRRLLSAQAWGGRAAPAGAGSPPAYR